MIMLLSKGECRARDLSQMLGIREKEVYAHLSHIERSVTPQKKKLIIIASRCLSCGYVFDTRKRFTKPGRCPRCKSERIQEPTYRVVQGNGHHDRH
jgi:predicted Zn-ribbon and HTH transcriptional regulator